MKRSYRILPISLLLVLSASILAAQQGPFNQNALVTLSATPSSVPTGSTFTVNVTANLTGVTGSCQANMNVPAVLAQYTIPINFNNTQVQYISASACNNAQFNTTPAATTAINANMTGQVTINSAQVASSVAPTGSVCVATLTFQSLGQQSVSAITPVTPTLTSALQNCSGGGFGGPSNIPATPSGVSVTVSGAPGAPMLSTASMMLLAVALSIAAAFALNSSKG